jgi:phage gp29-like protein
VQAPDKPSSVEKEAAELLSENLFGGMDGSWDDLLREATLGIYYGFRTPEICWEEREGLVAIRKLGSRNPELIESWLYDEGGQLAGYLYAGNRPIGSGLTSAAMGLSRYERIPIPIEKTVHFVYDGENENPSGFGMWRSMYAPYYIKQALLKILSIGIERNLLDVPVGKLGGRSVSGGNTETARKKLLTILRRWRAAEDAAVVLADGEELEFIGSQRSLMDAMPFLHFQNFQIAIAGLATFLNLGQSSVGTQALGSELAKVFQDAENANAHWIADTLNAQLVKRWVQLNYRAGLRAPKIAFRPIRARDLGTWANALNTLAGGGFLHTTVDDELQIREEMELPAIEREQLEKLQQERQAQAEVARERLTLAANAGAGEAKPGEKPDDARQATDCDHGHRFAEGDDPERTARIQQEQSFTNRATALLQEIETGYLAALQPLVEQSLAAGPLSAGKPLPDLSSVQVPGVRRYEEFVRGYLREVFDQGRQALAEETGQDADGTIPNKTRSWLNARAKVIAADHTGQLQTAVLTRVLTGIRGELSAEQIFTDASSAAIEELSRTAQEQWGQAAAEVLSLMDLR